MVVHVGRPKLKTAFRKTRAIAPLYTSGPVALTSDGTKIVTCASDEVLLTNVSNGMEICRFHSDNQTVHSLCLTPSATHLLVFTSSLSLFTYEIPVSSQVLPSQIHPIRTIPRAHNAPVHVCKVDPTSSYLASGSADGVVKVWDIARGYTTHVFKGHGGVAMRLITASVDTRIRLFNLTTEASTSGGGGQPEAILEGHVSVPRGLDVSADGRWLVSGGRDSVVLIWEFPSNYESSTISKSTKGKKNGKNRAPKLVRTVPTLERVEAVGLLTTEDSPTSATSSGNIIFYTGGEKGIINIWDGHEGRILYSLGQNRVRVSSDQEEQQQIIDVQYLPTSSIIVSVHADQNLLFHELGKRALTRQLIGFNDEIVDATFLSPSFPSSMQPSVKGDSHIALATNSSLIRVYETSTLDARLVEGHSEIVLALDHDGNGRILASGSKDRSARLWAPLESTDQSWGYGCVGICEGHAESVGAVVLPKNKDGSTALQFMFTGSQDRTIKMWDLSEVPINCSKIVDPDIVRCKTLTTNKAHEKDINSLDISPDSRFLVSGSQDRTAKIYEIEYAVGAKSRSSRGELRLVGTCKGHKRGIWTVRFGRTERVLATGSGDKTIKLWNLNDFSCLKTFEGHTNSVLRVDFFNMGMQLVSTASDGLVKLWNIREEECVATLDNHEDKVWALAVSADEKIIMSGAADSVVTFWEDCTEQQEEENELKRADIVSKNQDFLNYLALSDYKRAIELALAMRQPGRLLSLFRDVTSLKSSQDTNNSVTGHPNVDEVIRTMGGSDLSQLLRYVRDWNTSAKTSGVAQTILFAVFKLKSADELLKAFREEQDELVLTKDQKMTSGGSTAGTSLKELLDALVPYTERHLQRMDKLLQESFVVDYILGEMDDGMFDGDMEVD